MILLSTMTLGLTLLTFQVTVEWIREQRREFLHSYRTHFQRVEMVYPKFKL